MLSFPLFGQYETAVSNSLTFFQQVKILARQETLCRGCVLLISRPHFDGHFFGQVNLEIHLEMKITIKQIYTDHSNFLRGILLLQVKILS